MNYFNIHNNSDMSYTQISNIFIDEYMPAAHGAFVKVYITLVRMLSSSSVTASISGIADVLDIMENDVMRALSYWEKQHLLMIKRNATGIITDVAVMSPVSAASSSNSSINVVFNSNITSTTPPVKKLVPDIEDDPDILAKVSTKSEFVWLTGIIEKYMEKPLSMTDVDLIAYIYEGLKFPTDLILHLYEYCISHGKKNSKYIQTVAVNWAKEGVDSVEKAVAQSAKYETDYLDVMRAFGMNQAPAPAQKQYIDAWIAQGFSSELITEACNRTMINLNEPSFKYANGILENWHKHGITTLNDVKKADEEHLTKNADKQTAATANMNGKHTATPPARKSSTAYSAYDQRTYSSETCTSLEKQLLNRK